MAGCAKSPKVELLSNANTVSTNQAFATPPPGGPAVLGIIETSFTNGTQQDITLATEGNTPGQNLVRVQIIGVASNSITNGSSLSERIPTQDDISREIVEFLPGMTITRSPYFLQNKYGPFSYAAGRSAQGDTCLYAWQRMGHQAPKQSVFSPRGVVQIRLRLCDPVKSEQDLLSTMYGININVAVSKATWNPYGSPLPPPVGLGRTGSPINPLADNFPGVVPKRTGAPRAQARRAPARTQKPAATVKTLEVPHPKVALKAPSAPTPDVIVPPPPTNITGASSMTTSDARLGEVPRPELN
ncbi:cellulose biosynthesis protein BcsN [Roseibium algae]|uniref:Cellulose biosynthesis protein BcsN n=1 Tax=Roseibium algae TaxID=3123038 RepID=A0ABU8TIZ2_9HYPH